MKKLYFIATYIISTSCTKFAKYVYVDGRVYNPITGEGIPNIPIRLYRNTIDSKDPLGIGSKTLETTTTDANGYYKVEQATIMTFDQKLNKLLQGRWHLGKFDHSTH